MPPCPVELLKGNGSTYGYDKANNKVKVHFTTYYTLDVCILIYVNYNAYYTTLSVLFAMQ